MSSPEDSALTDPGTESHPARSVFPRKVGAGLIWIATCEAVIRDGVPYHSHFSCYLAVGSRRTMLIDTGYPKDWTEIHRLLLQALAGRALDYLLPTHPESPHMGNLPALLRAFPSAIAVGDLRDYHLHYPEFADRLETHRVGESISLGDSAVRLVPPVIHDLPNTLWAVHEASHVLFVGDAFTYAHGHSDNECALLSSELSWTPSLVEMAEIIVVLLTGRATLTAIHCSKNWRG